MPYTYNFPASFLSQASFSTVFNFDQQMIFFSTKANPLDQPILIRKNNVKIHISVTCKIKVLPILLKKITQKKTHDLVSLSSPPFSFIPTKKKKKIETPNKTDLDEEFLRSQCKLGLWIWISEEKRNRDILCMIFRRILWLRCDG